MRKILLSFSPKYYDVLRSGEKVFEYRKRFCNEGVYAYIYLGKPFQQIVGVAILGKRINLCSWYEKYSDSEVRKRIVDFMDRNKYAMPVKSFQEIIPINICEIKSRFPDFYIPLSFRNLEAEDELTKYIESNSVFIGERIIHNFAEINPENICKM